MKHCFKLHRNQKGYTLIELLFYIGVVGVMLVAISTFYALTAEARLKGQTVAEVDQQGQAAMSYILQTLRNADTVNAPASGGSAASLSLNVPDGALNPTVFDLNGTSLQVKESAAAAVPLTGGKVVISSLLFKNLSAPGAPGTIQVSFTAARNNPNHHNEFEYQKNFISSVTLRK